jgi:fatty acid-binding protein DegV
MGAIKKQQPILKMYCETDLKTFHSIRRAQKSVDKMRKKLNAFQSNLNRMYHTLVENSQGNIRTEIKP